MSARTLTVIAGIVAIVVVGAADSTDNSAAEFNGAGVGHYNAGRYEDAIDAFEQAYRLKPDNTTVRRNLCNAYQSAADQLAKDGQLSPATEYLQSAIDVDPDNASPLIQIGSYFVRLGMAADASFRLEEALELAPDNADGRELLGDAYYQMNDLAGALAQWLALKEIEPNRAGLSKKIEKANREDTVENGFRQSSSRHFEISFAPDTKPADMRRILTILEQAYGEIGRKLGGVFPPATIPVIIYDAKDFTEATSLGEHVGALYDGKIRAPFKDVQGNTLPEPELRRRLYHEYTHVVVHHIAQDDVPWWLNEGLSETFSRALDEEERAHLGEALKNGGLSSLALLEDQQLEKLDVASLRTAYMQAHATVDHLWTKFGARGMTLFLDTLAQGESPENALKLSYRRDYANLEKEVAALLRPPT